MYAHAQPLDLWIILNNSVQRSSETLKTRGIVQNRLLRKQLFWLSFFSVDTRDASIQTFVTTNSRMHLRLETHRCMHTFNRWIFEFFWTTRDNVPQKRYVENKRERPEPSVVETHLFYGYCCFFVWHKRYVDTTVCYNQHTNVSTVRDT